MGAAGGEVGKRRQEKKDAKDEKANKKAKKEARKNSGAPKRPPSAFWLWQTENREALVKEAGTSKIPVIGKLAGERWAKLDGAKKATFEKRAATLKVEYEKAMAEWKANNTGSAEEGEDGGDDDEDENEAEESPKKTPKAAENKLAENKPAENKPAGKAKASPKAKGKAKAKADAPRDELDAEVLKSAKDLGFETALRNLASREELKGKHAAEMLRALQNSNGLVNKAKAALLAGA